VLLGYANHDAYKLEDETAGTADAVNKMLSNLATAEANARKEAAEMQKLIDEQEKNRRAGRSSCSPGTGPSTLSRSAKAQYAYDDRRCVPTWSSTGW